MAALMRPTESACRWLVPAFGCLPMPTALTMVIRTSCRSITATRCSTWPTSSRAQTSNTAMSRAPAETIRRQPPHQRLRLRRLIRHLRRPILQRRLRRLIRRAIQERPAQLQRNRLRRQLARQPRRQATPLQGWVVCFRLPPWREPLLPRTSRDVLRTRRGIRKKSNVPLRLSRLNTLNSKGVILFAKLEKAGRVRLQGKEAP